MSGNCSIFRLQRPCVLLKGALWLFLVILFFVQQVGVILAAQPPHFLSTPSSVVITMPNHGIAK